MLKIQIVIQNYNLLIPPIFTSIITHRKDDIITLTMKIFIMYPKSNT